MRLTRDLLVMFLGILAMNPGAWADVPAKPRISDRVFKLKDFGAVGDDATMNTAAIQKAIDTCAAAGGGRIIVGPGNFFTGPFHLASNIDLNLQPGARILFSNNPKDFKVTNNRFQDCILAEKCHDVAITGSGAIDGQGQPWWAPYENPRPATADLPAIPHRPFMVVFDRCTRVLVQGVTLTDSPMFHLVPRLCEDVTIDGIRIKAPPSPESHNTDGIDPSGVNILITHCVIDTGDDCIAVQANGSIDATHASCENIVITDCNFLHGHGMSVSGAKGGRLNHLIVRNCTFNGTEAGIRLKSSRGDGALVENLTYENLTMIDVKYAIRICSYCPESTQPRNPADAVTDPVNAATPIWRHIRIDNLTSTGGDYAGQIVGLPEMHVSDVVFNNVKISARYALLIAFSDGIRFNDSTINVRSRPAIKVVESQIQGINPGTGR